MKELGHIKDQKLHWFNLLFCCILVEWHCFEVCMMCILVLYSFSLFLCSSQVVGLNFSSATSPELLLKTFDHYCEYRRTPNGVVMSPIQLGKWVVLFCDEINLPDTDKYGTQRVISFLRQIVEHGGFYRTSDQTWIRLERIQFVGACNPPTDPGRKPLSHRLVNSK